MNPEISIIVPVYNVEKYLHRCIESIINQTFSNYELILVDDGSTDQSGDICEEYARIDKRIKVIHKENGGQSSARNRGLEIAKGEYIGFVDSDDFIHERMYEILYNNALKNFSDVIICEVIKVPENQGINNKDLISQPDVQNFSNIEALNQLYIPFDPMGNDNEGWIFPVNKLYKKFLFDNISFRAGRIYEDEFIIHKILHKCNVVSFIPLKLYGYVQRKNSTVNSPYSIRKLDRVYALKERVEFFKEIDDNNLVHKALKCYIEVFFWNYFVMISQFPNEKTEIKSLKRTLRDHLSTTLKNPFISWKQKLFLFLFFLNPSISKKFIRSSC